VSGHDGGPAAAEARLGVVAGASAYALWGMFPLVFRLVEEVPAGEILLHRIVWSFVVVAALLLLRRDRRWFAPVRAASRGMLRLTLAAAAIAVNWLVYIWAVNSGNVVEAALGYYVNPLLTVALGVVVLGERLRHLQRWALGFGAAAVVVLTAAYGRMPWIALVLAASFATYGFLKKSVPVDATTSLAVETSILLLPAAGAMVALQVRGDAAFLAGPVGRDLVLLSLGLVTAVPLLLFGTAARRIPLSLVGLLMYLTPTMQLLIGVVVLDEPLPPERLAGFVLVWTALTLLAVDAVRALRQTRREARTPASGPPGEVAPAPEPL